MHNVDTISLSLLFQLMASSQSSCLGYNGLAPGHSFFHDCHFTCAEPYGPIVAHYTCPARKQ